MRPKTDAAVYRPDLGIIFMEYVEGQTMGFIADQVLPIFPTTMQASAFPVVPQEALLKLVATERAPRATYGRDDFEYERGTYQTGEYGFEEPVDDSERGMIEGETYTGLADELAVQRAYTKVLRDREKRVADIVFNTTNFTVHDVTTEWSTAATAAPFDNLRTAKLAIRSACGMLPNCLILSFENFENLKATADIQDRIQYTYPMADYESISVQMMAHVLGIPRILIGGAVYDTKGKGIDTTIGDIWDDEYAMLTIISDGQRNIQEPCIGRTFLWTVDSPQNPVVESYREEQTRSDIYRVRFNVAETLIQSKNSSGTVVSNIASACSYLLGNIAA